MVPSCRRQHTAMRLPRANIAESLLGDPAKRALGLVRVLDPRGDRFGQVQHALPRASSQLRSYRVPQPAAVRARFASSSCKVVSAASTKGCKALPQLDIARKEATGDHFLRLGGKPPAHLPSPAVLARGLVPLGGKGGGCRPHGRPLMSTSSR